ncbi:hypothetical protein RND81_03G087800 [Saponaria officinalis]
MSNKCGLSIFIMLIINISTTKMVLSKVNRSSFPHDFIFGAGTSAYQIEGAANVDGKGLSNWDYFTHKDPRLVIDGSNADVAADFYHRYKEDIKLMKEIGLDSFRFSISWPRILPNGTKEGGVNEHGIRFYNNLIDELLRNGIQPFVTLYHWDLPQTLEENYKGFLSNKIVSDFVEYADICFKEFGDRVKYWVTLNEPNIVAMLGYAKGVHVPQRCTPGIEGYPPCREGNSSTEPYLVGHHFLLAHASAVKLYKDTYQSSQKGQIGITVGCDWGEPYDNSEKNKQAAERYYEHFCGWMFNPVKFGEYPETMRLLVGDRLPKFTEEETNMLKNSFDFLALNSYSSTYVRDQSPKFKHYDQDDHANKTFRNEKGFIGRATPSDRIYEYPQGFKKLVIHMKNKYENPTIIITENGYPTTEEDVNHEDTPRKRYIQQHLSHLLQAMKSGANVKGYFVWAIMDDFEWNAGYLSKYGLIYVDRKDDLKRHIKKSGKWYRTFLHS